jgi:ribosomal protein S18 acetylase RimI-like enzyme
MDLRLYDLREDDFDGIIRLGDAVYGKNYLDHNTLEKIYRLSCSRGLCCSKVMYDSSRGVGKLIGFRLTYAPGTWQVDEWCSPQEWRVDSDKVCYFKSNTVDPNYQGMGIGSHLLEVSTHVAKNLGAEAGVAHIWMNSPESSAFRYFVKNGAQLVWVWPNRWSDKTLEYGSVCAHCGTPCECSAAEMIIYFGEQEKNE